MKVGEVWVEDDYLLTEPTIVTGWQTAGDWWAGEEREDLYLVTCNTKTSSNGPVLSGQHLPFPFPLHLFVFLEKIYSLHCMRETFRWVKIF